MSNHTESASSVMRFFRTVHVTEWGSWTGRTVLTWEGLFEQFTSFLLSSLKILSTTAFNCSSLFQIFHQLFIFRLKHNPRSPTRIKLSVIEVPKDGCQTPAVRQPITLAVTVVIHFLCTPYFMKMRKTAVHTFAERETMRKNKIYFDDKFRNAFHTYLFFLEDCSLETQQSLSEL